MHLNFVFRVTQGDFLGHQGRIFFAVRLSADWKRNLCYWCGENLQLLVRVPALTGIGRYDAHITGFIGGAYPR